jgi:hypothetical protein
MQCHLDGAIYMYNMKHRMVEEYAIDIYYDHWHVYLQRKHVCAQDLPAGLALSKLGRRGGRVHCNRFS